MSMIVIIMGKYGFIFSMVFCILFLGFCLFNLAGFCILFQLRILLLVVLLLVWVRLVSFFYFASFLCSFFSSLFIRLFVFFMHFFQFLHWNSLHCCSGIVWLFFLMHVHLFCCSCFSVVIFIRFVLLCFVVCLLFVGLGWLGCIFVVLSLLLCRLCLLWRVCVFLFLYCIRLVLVRMCICF